MTSEIKQRIEQIRNGEVPKGYKRTRAGIMPCDWCTQKEYKAKDIFYSVSNKSHNGDYEVLSATQDRGVIPRSQVDIDIKYDDANTSGYKMVDKGDFVISLRSFQGGIEYSKYTGLVSPAYTVLKPRVSICDEYYKSYFKTNDFISRLNKGTYGIRDGKQVGFKDFGEMTIHFPPLPEQQRIANILSTQDKVIECYEKKIEQLKRMKKYYLQNMFPKRGKTVPKIRFKGFTDPWEHKKLGDITASYSGGTPTAGKSEYYDGAIPFIRSGEIGKDHTELFISEIGLKNSSAAMVNIGDILYALYGATSGEVSRSKIKGAINQAILAILPNRGYDPEYLMQWLRMKKEPIINAFLQGGQGNLSGTIVKGLTVDIPCYDEQVSIGQYFSYIDNLITLHQRKLEEEKNNKKALQQLLLTGIVRV